MLMAFISDTSSAATGIATTGVEKPVVVRVKRKSWQSRLDAFWLEINERPLKRRPVLDFDKLSIDDDYSTHRQGKLNAKKVYVRHLETVDTSETIIDVVQSLVYNSADAVNGKPEIYEQKRTFKKDRKPEELLYKGRRDQKVLAQSSRFEQIWRSRRGKKEALHDKLHDMCRFYEIVRVHDEEGSNEVQEQETMCLEDQRILSRHLPISREFIPSAVAEIESDIYAYLSEQGYKVMPRTIADIESDIHAYMYKQDDYVYDYYTAKNDLDMGEQDDISLLLPVVQVEDDVDFYDGPDYESENDSDDSNAEAHPQNDYPDETSEKQSASSTDKENEEDEKGDGASSISEEEEEEEKDNSDSASSTSAEFEDLRHGLAQDGVPSHHDKFCSNYDGSFDYMDINEDLCDMDINKDSR